MPRDNLPPASDESPVQRGRGRPLGDHDAKRAEILRAAIRVIARDGYAGASLRKVAQSAGCTTGAVTYYFANKEAMVVAVAESLFDTWYSLLIDQNGDGTIKASLERWLAWTGGEDPDPLLALYQLLGPARHEPALADAFQRRYAQYRQTLASFLAEMQKAGQVRDDIAADLLADQICALGDGWMIDFPIEPEWFTQSRIRALVDATVRMVSPPTA